MPLLMSIDSMIS